jgi:hypothetical protein
MEEDEDSESEDPKLDDLLALDLNLQPEGVTPVEATELESRIKKDFNVLLNEPKKSLRRTFAYVGGIIRYSNPYIAAILGTFNIATCIYDLIYRGYLRRGKSDINWIKIMRSNSYNIDIYDLSYILYVIGLEGREFEDRILDENDPYVGTKLSFDKLDEEVHQSTNVSDTWNSMTKLFENRHNERKCKPYYIAIMILTYHLFIIAEFVAELYKYYDHNPDDVTFYLPQLCNLLLNQYTAFQPLKKFILDKCSQSVHFALQVNMISILLICYLYDYYYIGLSVGESKQRF